VSIVWPVKKAGYIPQYIGPRYATWNWVKTYRRQTVIWRITFRKYQAIKYRIFPGEDLGVQCRRILYCVTRHNSDTCISLSPIKHRGHILPDGCRLLLLYRSSIHWTSIFRRTFLRRRVPATRNPEITMKGTICRRWNLGNLRIFASEIFGYLNNSSRLTHLDTEIHECLFFLLHLIAHNI